jgi:PKD repeat protein
VNTEVFFNGSASFADRNTGRSIVRYDWNFADGTTAGGATVTHRFSAPGTYNVVLTVTDDVGVTDEQSTPVAVTSGNPVATMTVTPNPTRVNQPTTFNASASTSAAGSTIVSYSFNYGDGSPAEVSPVPIQTHIYGGTPGVGAPQPIVTAILTVTDSAGRTGTFAVQVTINP